MTTEEQLLGLCERFFAAVTAGDLDAVREIYAPEAITWHNHDNTEQALDQTLRVLAALPRFIKDFRYEDVRRYAIAEGFVEQHVVRGSTMRGEEIAIPAVVICKVVKGRITRLDEYLDSAQLAALFR